MRWFAKTASHLPLFAIKCRGQVARCPQYIMAPKRERKRASASTSSAWKGFLKGWKPTQRLLRLKRASFSKTERGGAGFPGKSMMSSSSRRIVASPRRAGLSPRKVVRLASHLGLASPETPPGSQHKAIMAAQSWLADRVESARQQDSPKVDDGSALLHVTSSTGEEVFFRPGISPRRPRFLPSLEDTTGDTDDGAAAEEESSSFVALTTPKLLGTGSRASDRTRGSGGFEVVLGSPLPTAATAADAADDADDADDATDEQVVPTHMTSPPIDSKTPPPLSQLRAFFVATLRQETERVEQEREVQRFLEQRKASAAEAAAAAAASDRLAATAAATDAAHEGSTASDSGSATDAESAESAAAPEGAEAATEQLSPPYPPARKSCGGTTPADSLLSPSGLDDKLSMTSPPGRPITRRASMAMHTSREARTLTASTHNTTGPEGGDKQGQEAFSLSSSVTAPASPSGASKMQASSASPPKTATSPPQALPKLERARSSRDALSPDAPASPSSARRRLLPPTAASCATASCATATATATTPLLVATAGGGGLDGGGSAALAGSPASDGSSPVSKPGSVTEGSPSSSSSCASSVVGDSVHGLEGGEGMADKKPEEEEEEEEAAVAERHRVNPSWMPALRPASDRDLTSPRALHTALDAPASLLAPLRLMNRIAAAVRHRIMRWVPQPASAPVLLLLLLLLAVTGGALHSAATPSRRSGSSGHHVRSPPFWVWGSRAAPPPPSPPSRIVSRVTALLREGLIDVTAARGERLAWLHSASFKKAVKGVRWQEEETQTRGEAVRKANGQTGLRRAVVKRRLASAMPIARKVAKAIAPAVATTVPAIAVAALTALPQVKLATGIAARGIAAKGIASAKGPLARRAALLARRTAKAVGGSKISYVKAVYELV